MKFLFPLAWLACCLHASAETPVSAKETPAQSKARIGATLRGARDDRVITQKQYRQALAWLDAAPCSGVDRRLDQTARGPLEAGIARQQGRDKVRVFESFKLRGWSAIFSDAGPGDEPFYFYASDPAQGAQPRAAWAGAATVFETTEMTQWIQKQAPGIPKKLADCVAWHVTMEGRSFD